MLLKILPRINDLAFLLAKENSNNLWRIPNTAQVFIAGRDGVWDLDYEIKG